MEVFRTIVLKQIAKGFKYSSGHRLAGENADSVFGKIGTKCYIAIARVGDYKVLSVSQARLTTELIKATVDGMAARGFGRIINITSSAVKFAHRELGSVERCAQWPDRIHRRQDNIASRNVTINNLQPGSFDTDRLRGKLVAAAEESGQDCEAFLAECRGEIPAKR